jgi:hypothetical protein
VGELLLVCATNNFFCGNFFCESMLHRVQGTPRARLVSGMSRRAVVARTRCKRCKSRSLLQRATCLLKGSTQATNHTCNN